MADAVTPLTRLINVLTTYSGRDKALQSLYFALILAASRLTRRRANLAEQLLDLARQLSRARLVARQLNFLQLLQASWKIPKQLRDAYRHATASTHRCSIQDYQFSTSNGNLMTSYASTAAAGKSPSSVTCATPAHASNYRDLNPPSIAGLTDAIWRMTFTRHGRAIAVKLIDEILAASVTLLYTLNTSIEFVAWIAEARLIPANATRWFRYSLYCWISALFTGVLRQILRVQKIGWTTPAGAGERLTLTGIVSDLIAALNMLPGIFLRPGSRKLTMTQSAAFSLFASLIGFYKTF